MKPEIQRRDDRLGQYRFVQAGIALPSQPRPFEHALQDQSLLPPVSLLEVLEDRPGRAFTLLTSQLPVSQWHQAIGDPTIADAICDRIVHTAHRLELKGESVRKLDAHRQEAKGREAFE